MARHLEALGAAFILTLGACSGDTADQAAAPAPAETPEAVEVSLEGAIEPVEIMGEWVSNHYRERTAMFSTREVAPGGLAMVGDSITEGGDWSVLLPGEDAVNFGISGDIAEGVAKRLAQVEAAQPSRVMLMIGTNDLGHGMSPEQIGDEVEKVLDGFHQTLEGQQVYVQSVLPRQPEFAGAVKVLNQRLEHEAYMRGMWFVYLHDAFLDESGTMLEPSMTDDSLHLNEAGYAKWAGMLQPYLDGFPMVPGTDIAIPAHYPPGGKVHYADRAAMFAAREVAPGKVAFVGDSITEGGDWAALFPELDTVNFGIGWDQTSGLLNRIDQIRAAAPSKIVLLIGTNDLGNGQPVAEAAANTQAAIAEFKTFVPAEEILVQAVMPREADRNAEVLELNARLERIAAEEGVDFLDIYTPLLVEDHLDPTITEDSLHLTAAGYQRWKGELAPWLSE